MMAIFCRCFDALLWRDIQSTRYVSSRDLRDKFDGKALGDALREKRIHVMERARIGATTRKNDGHREGSVDHRSGRTHRC